MHLVGLLLTTALGLARAEESAAVRDIDRAPTIDGKLDEAVWQGQPAAQEFVRYLPNPGGPHASRTQVWFLQDDKNLYVGVRVTENEGEIRAHISPREDVNVDDQIGVYIDPFGDARTGYIFYVNLHGIQQDIRHAYGSWYVDWDTVFQSGGRRIEGGYEIELAFPWRSLRYPETSGERGVPEQDWKVMITRKIPEEGVKLSWPAMAPNYPRIFEQGARLTGVKPSPRGAGVELIPVLAVRGNWDQPDTGGDLLWQPQEQQLDTLRPGLDARIGITPDLGLAATVLPDFSQVEGDVLQVDLNQRFAFYYPEQRPFFLDGVDAFNDLNGTLYTRSVVAPLYGLKLSGQADRLGLGVLQAYDTDPAPSVHERGTPGFAEAEVEGMEAINAYGRARIDLDRNGYVGVTAADKRLVDLGGDPASAAPGAFNDVFALDTQQALGEVWTVSARAAGSLAGRPGQPLVGHNVGASLNRAPALGTGLWLFAGDSSLDYRNELGFQTQSGITGTNGSVSHRVALGDGDSVSSSSVGAVFNEERVIDGFADGYRSASANQSFTLAGNHNLSGWGNLARFRERGVQVDGWSTGGGYNALFSNALQGGASGSHARTIDFAQLIPATASRAEVSLNIRPTVGTRLDLLATWQWFTPDGQETGRAARYWTRFNWQLTRELGVRAIAQTRLSTDEEDPVVTPSLLLTWLKHPGTEAYLGATSVVATDGSGITELAAFAKASWLFRL